LKLKDLIKETKMVSYYSWGDKANTLFFWKMSNGDGKFKSDKQANYFYNLYKRSSTDMMSQYDSKIKSPAGTEMIFYIELEINPQGQWRGKARRKARILYMNRNGIIKYDEVKFEYHYEKGGGSGSGVKDIANGKTFNTPDYVEKPAAPKTASTWDKIKASSNFIGAVGKREILKLTVYKVNDFQSRYGTTYIFLMYDKDYNMVVYKGRFLSKKGEDYSDRIDDNKEHIIECKIKKHDMFQGIKQTVIERPLVIS